MNKMKADELLCLMAERLLEYLEDLKDYHNEENTQFAYGEKSAFTECLEMIQFYERAKEIGLDFNIEEKYPL